MTTPPATRAAMASMWAATPRAASPARVPRKYRAWLEVASELHRLPTNDMAATLTPLALPPTLAVALAGRSRAAARARRS